MDPSALVAAGYDPMAERHLAWIDEIKGDPRLYYPSMLLEKLTPESLVIDLGCGAGVPSTALMAQQHRVLGVDISEVQLRLAAERVPSAMLARADLGSLALRRRCADAITAFYALGHVPRNMHARVLTEVLGALRPGGWLLTTMSVDGTEDTVQEDFLGVRMFFSGFDAETNKRMVQEAGFQLVTAEAVTMREPEGEARFLWLLAQRPDAA